MATLSCDPETLAVDSKCIACIPEGRKLDALILLFVQLTGMTTDAETLSQESKCYACIPPGRKLDVLIFVACQIANGIGGSGQIVIYTGTDPTSDGLIPTDPTKPAIAYKPGDQTWDWNPLTQTWV